MILQVARGMSHLESKNIVHCGLQARKILIGENGEVKVSGLEYGTGKVNKHDQWTRPYEHKSPTRTPQSSNQNVPSSMYDKLRSVSGLKLTSTPQTGIH